MSAKKVKVWNDNTVDLEEEFKGQKIKIPAGDFIEMGRSQAVQFKGQYKPMKIDGMKQQTKASMKILRLEPLKGKGSSKPDKKEWVCQIDGHVCRTEQGLKTYMKKNYPDAENVKK